MPELVVDQVAKDYPTPSEPLHVLRGCSLTLNRGQNLAILGPSGSGKSTLLSIIGTLERPTSGTVTLAGEDPHRYSDRELATFRNQKIGFVFQDHHLLPQCTVLENVLVPTLATGATKPALVERAHRLIERVGLDNRLEHRPAELSGGERQRVAIARALIEQPPLLLADEPTGNLDQATSTQCIDLLLELQQSEGTMLVVVTHSLELAARLETRLEMHDGRLDPQ